MTPEALIDNLTYAGYRHNRDLFPRIAPERWARVFKHAAVLEKRYQDEEEALASFGEEWYEELGYARVRGQEIPVLVMKEM